MIKKDRLVKTFIELVKIDSPSGEEAEFASFLSKKLKQLGAYVSLDAYDNVIAKLKGNGPPLMLNAHLDTVEPGRNIKPIIKNDIITSDGSTVLGADPKAGIAIILEALTSIIEENKSHPNLELVFTREEETSLGGAMNLDYSQISAREGIVFDGDEEVFKIYVSSPTYYALDVEIIGKAAHAGIEPEKGISAIEIASKLISNFSLGRIDEETTVNIGTIVGGSVRNAVPEKVTFQGEIRSRNKKTLEKIITKKEKIFKTHKAIYANAKINYTFNKDFEGFKLEENHPLIKKAKNVMINKLGFKPVLKDSGGGSDANFFFTKDIEVIIVGTGTYEAHTTREYLKIPELFDAAKFCEAFILDYK